MNSSNSSLRKLVSTVNNSVTSLRSIVSRNKIQPIQPTDNDATSDIYEIKEFDDYKPHQPKPVINKSLTSLVPEKEDNHECGKKFFSVVRRAWATRYTEEVSSNKVNYLKTAFRELITYIIFLFFLLMVAYGTKSNDLFYLSTAMQNVFISVSNFQSMNSVNSFWRYMTNDFVSGLYWSKWYNQLPDLQPNEQGFIYFENKLVGVPQIRQLRIKPNTCNISPYVQKVFTNCWGDYSTDNSNTSAFGKKNGSAWTYQPTDPVTQIYSGSFYTYDSGGFVQQLSQNSTTTLNMLNDLQSNLWIDHGTRVVFVEFTVYNANVNLYCIVKIILEFPPMGGINNLYQIRTIKLLRYESPFDLFILGCEIIVIFFIVYYTIEEILEIQRNRLAYFKKVWNLLDIFMVITSFVSIVLNINRVIKSYAVANSLVSDPNVYANFDFCQQWNKYFNDSMAVNTFFAVVKIFKYISFNKTMNQLTDTLANSLKDMIGFLIMFLIVYCAFAQWGYLQFGSQIIDFYKFQDSIFALFRLVLGDFNFANLQKADSFIGPVFFISYIFFVFFVLLNMFIAIINDSYEAVKENLSKSNDDFRISQFLQMQFFNKFQKHRVVKIQEVLENSAIKENEQLTFQTWRDELQSRGYAEVEIQALFLRYDSDGDRTLDYEERRKMLNDLKCGKLSLEETSDENKGSNVSLQKENETEFVDEELFSGMVEKVDGVEKNIHQIINKIDEILMRLDNIEKVKLDHQKTVRCSLNILAGYQNDTTF